MTLTAAVVLLALSVAAVCLTAVGFATLRLLRLLLDDARGFAARYLDARADVRKAISAYEAAYQDAVGEMRRLEQEHGRRIGRLEVERANGPQRGRDVIATGLRPGG